MSSTRTAPRTTNINKTSSSTLNTHHTNGSANSYDTNDSSNTSEYRYSMIVLTLLRKIISFRLDSNLQRPVLTKNHPPVSHRLSLGQRMFLFFFSRREFIEILDSFMLLALDYWLVDTLI